MKFVLLYKNAEIFLDHFFTLYFLCTVHTCIYYIHTETYALKKPWCKFSYGNEFWPIRRTNNIFQMQETLFIQSEATNDVSSLQRMSRVLCRFSAAAYFILSFDEICFEESCYWTKESFSVPKVISKFGKWKRIDSPT